MGKDFRVPNEAAMGAEVVNFTESAVARQRKDCELNRAGIKITADLIRLVMPVLPEGWDWTYRPWGTLTFANAVAGTEPVPKEEFRLAVMAVEKAAQKIWPNKRVDIKMTPNAQFEGTELRALHAQMALYYQEDLFDGSLLVSVIFYHGDCKVTIEDKVVRTPRVIDPCLRLHEDEAS